MFCFESISLNTVLDSFVFERFDVVLIIILICCLNLNFNNLNKISLCLHSGCDRGPEAGR